MKKTLFYLPAIFFAASMFTACTQDKVVGDEGPTKMGEFKLTVEFSEGLKQTRTSTAIPTTGWENIKQLQFFLYNAAGKIAFSAIVTPAEGVGNGTSKEYTYPNIPIGAYTLVAVANSQSGKDNVFTYGTSGATEQKWTSGNVYGKLVSDMLIRHKAEPWPSAYKSPIPDILKGLTSHSAPAEVFMGATAAGGVTITTGNTTTATIPLKREVALIRARVDKATHPEASKTDFTHANAGLMFYCLPEQMKIGEGTNGGVGTGSIDKNALVALGGFSPAAAGYTEGSFSLWKDIIVFPNNGGRAYDGSPGAIAANERKYFFVLCGVAKAGHVYADNTVAKDGDLIFWSGPVNGVFTPNTIREVDMVVKTGGSPTPPPGKIEYGGLKIVVNHPMPWDSNIVSESVTI